MSPAEPITRADQRGWLHRDGTPGVVFETFDALDLSDPFGPRKLHLMLPEAPAPGPLPLVVFQDGDTTFWRGGVAHASWHVGRTVARLQRERRLGPIAVAAVCPRNRDEEYTHVDWRGGRAPWGGLDRYAAWVAGTLVPWLREAHPEIDPSREATGVAGSSHGALAAFRIATSHARTFGVAGCFSPSFFSGLDDLDRGPMGVPLESSDLVRRAAPVLADPALRPRLWIDWGLRRDGGHHDAMVEALAALRGDEMAGLLEHRFGARVARIHDGPGPADADVVVLVDRIGGHDERAWEHRAGLFLETFFGRPSRPGPKHRARSTVFVAGVAARPGPALDDWLAAHAGHEVRLPFTVWRGALGRVERAAVGDVEVAPDASVRLSDAALGISLADRLRAACGAESRCVVLLSGRFGALLPEASPGPVFSVLAFHGVASPGVGTAAARPPDCLAIRAMRPLHCARGPARCEKCREASRTPPRPRLLDVCPDDAATVARPVIDLVRGGRTEHRPFDVLREFADEAEARAFAAEHGIEDVSFEPD